MRYPVVWREGAGPVRAGGLELGEDAVGLHGSGRGEPAAQRAVPYAELTEVRIGRAPGERLNGHPSLILERREGEPISISAISGLGVPFELGELLDELTSRKRAGPSRVVVVVPIRRGAAEKARRLVRAGPPFDPRELPLEAHHVFVTEREVVFLFEGEGARQAVERLARNPAVWKAAAAWKECIAGRPRVAEEGYSWARGAAGGASAPAGPAEAA